MVVLAKALQQAGHEVVIAASEDAAHLVQAHGVPYHRLCGPFDALMPTGQDGFGKLLQTLRVSVGEQFESFSEVARGADSSSAARGCSAAPVSPSRSASPSAASSTVHARCPRPTTPRSPTPAAARPGGSTGSCGGSMTSPCRRSWEVSSGSGAPAMGWDGEFNAYGDLMTARPILAADPLLAPLPVDLVSSTDQVGALFLDDPQPLPTEVEAFLARGEPPVYIGFGSVKDPDPARTTRVFVEAVRLAGVRAVLSRGWAGLGAGGAARHRAGHRPRLAQRAPAAHARHGAPRRRRHHARRRSRRHPPGGGSAPL